MTVRAYVLAGQRSAQTWTPHHGGRSRTRCATKSQVASPLVRRPYDLRHAAASLWLNAGVPPTEVARRLSHGVAVLLRYATCIDGGDDTMNDKIRHALR